MMPSLVSLGFGLLAQSGATPPPASDHTATVGWAIVLCGVALILFGLEIIIPSGGIIGVISLVCLIAGVVLFWRIDTRLGLASATVSLLALPFAFGFALKIWPNTPLGRMLILRTGRDGVEADETERNGEPAKPGEPEPAVSVRVGQTGKTLTPMRPVGTCLFDGQREECLAVSGGIERGQVVRVVQIDGRQIKVRPV